MAADEANPDRCFRMFEIHKLEGIDTGAAKSDRLRRKTRTPKSWSLWAMTSACGKSARTTAGDRPKVH